MSDSSEDSDCFESADEGLDDCDTKSVNENGNTRVDDNSRETPALKSTNMSASDGSVDPVKTSLQYRKRPERGTSSPKTRHNNAQQSSYARKISLNEQIFKSDIIKPDVLIQDITSNLSKKINKGFSTIQQKSNSIKGIVMNSITAATSKKTDRFSYDDNSEVLPYSISGSEDSDDNIDDDDDDNSNNIDTYPKDINMSAEPGQLNNESLSKSNAKSCVETNETDDFLTVVDNEVELNTCLQPDAICSLPSEKKLEILDLVKTECISQLIEDLCLEHEEGGIGTDDRKEYGGKEVEENIKDPSERNNEQDVLATMMECAISNNELNITGTSEDLNSENCNSNAIENLKEERLGNYYEKDEWNSSKLNEDDLQIESGEPGHQFNVPQMPIPTIEHNNDYCLGSNDRNDEGCKDVASDDNEGWDDFDIDDEDIDQVVNNEINLIKPTENTNSMYSQNHNVSGWTKSYFNEENDRKEPEKDTKWSGWDKFGEKNQNKSNSGWSLHSWGVNALLNTATSVTREISNVLEAGLGAPDPETLARMEIQVKGDQNVYQDKTSSVVNKENDCSTNTKNPDSNSVGGGLNLFPSFGITNLVAEVTNKIVEHSKVQEIGSKVISGGLDTLESFGKKTMEVLQDGDPGLKKKRALLLGSDKPVLSQVLRDAKAKAEIEDKKLEERKVAKMCHFETLFDDFQGLIHLEALEMLSTQCELKLDQMRASLPTKEADDFIGILDEVKELCIIDDDEIKSSCSTMVDFKSSLTEGVEPLKNEISVIKIVQVHEEFEEWMKNYETTKKSSIHLFQKAMSTLAELTAVTVQQFHRGGELLSIKEHRKTVEEADALLQMTSLVCCEVNEIIGRCLKLNASPMPTSEHDHEMVKKVKDEAANAISYIKDAFNLLIPVLQLGAAL